MLKERRAVDIPEELDGTPYHDYVLDNRWSFTTSNLV
jgi:hypothetical protein